MTTEPPPGDLPGRILDAFASRNQRLAADLLALQAVGGRPALDEAMNTWTAMLISEIPENVLREIRDPGLPVEPVVLMPSDSTLGMTSLSAATEFALQFISARLTGDDDTADTLRVAIPDRSLPEYVAVLARTVAETRAAYMPVISMPEDTL